MKIFTKSLIAFSILFTAAALHAQQNPPFKGWKYIDAGHYRIIFPERLEKTAQRTANLMIHYEKYNYAGMSTEPDYIPIVIIDDYSEANGFVSPAPFYSHWFTTPSSFDSVDWFTGLAIHEGRHIVQRNRMQEGGAKFTWYILLGNYGTALYEGLFIPVWYFEGDAVVMETALTNGGRGRIASFPLWYRSLELSGKRYSYYRAYLGTYNDMYPYPSPYSLGYLINSHIRLHNSRRIVDDLLEKTDDASCSFPSCLGNSFIFPSYNYSLKILTGRDISDTYNAAMDEYREYWKNNLAGIKLTESEILIQGRKETWESFIFPFTSGDQLYALQFARDRKFSLVKVRESKTEEIRMMPYNALSPLFHHERGLSAGGEFILWRETVPDPRWGYRTYSDIKLYDLVSGETFGLTDKGKFIAAAISADGLTAAGIEYTAVDGYSLSMFSTQGKNVLNRFELGGTGHVYDPAVEGSRVALCSQDKEGNSIIIMDTASGKREMLTGMTHLEHFRSPVFHENYLFYVSDYTGIDNIYAVNIDTKEKFQVTSVMHGAYFPFIDRKNNSILYNEYSITGYKTASVKINPENWTPFEKLIKPGDPYIDAIAAQELAPDGIVPDDLPEKEYKVNEYYTLLHGMTIPGWIPFFDFSNYDFSFNIYTRDVLHTLLAGASCTYNFNEKTGTAAGTITYSGLYPVLSLTGSYGRRTLWIEDEENRFNGIEYISWNEKAAIVDMNLPLNFSRGINSTYFTLGAKSGLIDVTDVDPPVYRIYSDMERNGLLKYSAYYLAMRHTITGAKNAVQPRWGEAMNISYWHTPWDADYSGRMISSDITLFMPSVFDTHGFRLSGAYVLNDTDDYMFTQQVLFTRGYEAVVHEKFIGASADYVFPIADFSFSPAESFKSLTGYSFFLLKLLYFKRLNGAVYFDYGRGSSEGLITDYRSAGFELTSVQNLFSNPYLLFEAGIRYSYCFDTGENVYSIVLKVPLLEM